MRQVTGGRLPHHKPSDGPYMRPGTLAGAVPGAITGRSHNALAPRRPHQRHRPVRGDSPPIAAQFLTQFARTSSNGATERLPRKQERT